MRLRLLVVDDEPLILTSIRRYLRRAHDVVALDRAGEALAILFGGASFDAVLCDVHMPGMSGHELRDTLRCVAPALAERFVWMTGSDPEPALLGGALAVLPKPFTLEELEAVLERINRAMRDSAPGTAAPAPTTALPA